MITNERQYRVSKAQLSNLRKAAEVFCLDEAAERIGSKILAKAELEAIRSEVEILSAQLREYEALKSGMVTVLKADNLSELPSILIRARIVQGLSQRELANKLGLKEQQIQRYESEEYASASLRRLTEIADALKLNISEVVELRQMPRSERSEKPLDIAWSRFPVKEMYRRGWFGQLGFIGSMADAMAEADSLARVFVTSVIRYPEKAMLRQRVRSGSVLDPYALLAWKCRVLTLAEKSPAKGTYERDSLDDRWLTKLAQESRFPDGPTRAQEYLANAGIRLVIEPHLPRTYLDGAALLYKDSHTIALTLRCDRLDNFWFVLLHEVIHVMEHLRKGRVEDILDDMDAEPDELEREADKLAGQVLIPENDWEMALARYIRSEDSVNALAEQLSINPAIIAGRIRKEADNYTILNKLVGQGEVRKHFPEVKFGW